MNDFIVQAMKRKDMTVEELAARVGVSPCHMYKIIEHNINATSGLAKRIAVEIGCDPKELIVGNRNSLSENQYVIAVDDVGKMNICKASGYCWINDGDAVVIRKGARNVVGIAFGGMVKIKDEQHVEAIASKFDTKPTTAILFKEYAKGV